MKKEYKLIWKWKVEEFKKVSEHFDSTEDFTSKSRDVGKLEMLNELADLLLKIGYGE